MYAAAPATVDDCALCDKLGRHIGALQLGIAALERDRLSWIDQNEIGGLGFFDKIKILLSIYILVWAVGYNIDEIWNTDTVQKLSKAFIAKFDDDYTDEIE